MSAQSPALTSSASISVSSDSSGHSLSQFAALKFKKKVSCKGRPRVPKKQRSFKKTKFDKNASPVVPLQCPPLPTNAAVGFSSVATPQARFTLTDAPVRFSSPATPMSQFTTLDADPQVPFISPYAPNQFASSAGQPVLATSTTSFRADSFLGDLAEHHTELGNFSNQSFFRNDAQQPSTINLADLDSYPY